MRSLLQNPEVERRPRGVVWLAQLFFVMAAVIVIYGLMITVHAISFTRARWLIGMDAAQMGPAIFAVATAVYVACGVGLLRVSRWGRWLAIAILLWGLVQQVPAVSAAVAESHVAAVVREGLLFIVRVACLRYLFLEDVREAFDKSRVAPKFWG
jgi:hypothetical protein